MGWLCGVGIFGLIECSHSLPALHSRLQMIIITLRMRTLTIIGPKYRDNIHHSFLSSAHSRVALVIHPTSNACKYTPSIQIYVNRTSFVPYAARPLFPRAQGSATLWFILLANSILFKPFMYLFIPHSVQAVTSTLLLKHFITSSPSFIQSHRSQTLPRHCLLQVSYSQVSSKIIPASLTPSHATANCKYRTHKSLLK